MLSGEIERGGPTKGRRKLSSSGMGVAPRSSSYQVMSWTIWQYPKAERTIAITVKTLDVNQYLFVMKLLFLNVACIKWRFCPSAYNICLIDGSSSLYSLYQKQIVCLFCFSLCHLWGEAPVSSCKCHSVFSKKRCWHTQDMSETKTFWMEHLQSLQIQVFNSAEIVIFTYFLCTFPPKTQK